MTKEKLKDYLCVVPRKHFLRDGCNIIQKELMPFSFIVDLIHVNVDGGNIFVATLDPFILQHKRIHLIKSMHIIISLQSYIFNLFNGYLYM